MILELLEGRQLLDASNGGSHWRPLYLIYHY